VPERRARVVCANVKGGWSRARAGGFICSACYRREFAPKERCGVCGKVGYVQARRDDVTYCDACYKRLLNVAPCVHCHQTLTVHGRDVQRRPVCQTCWERHHAPREVCSFCGHLEPPAHRGDRGEPICRACWHREIHRAPCADCGREANIATRTTEGEPLCHHCAFARRPRERCPSCRVARPLIDCRDGSRVCEPCWRRYKEPHYAWSSCGKSARAASWITADRPICASCWARAGRSS
jgi:hypothetical protein